MSYVGIYRERRRRRRLDFRPMAAAAVLVAGVVAVVLVAPPGKPETAVPDRAPGVGDVLHAGADSAVVRGVLQLQAGDVLAAVSHVRGRHGRVAYVITGCKSGAGLLREYGTGREHAWTRGEAHIFAIIARAACDAAGNTQEEV